MKSVVLGPRGNKKSAFRESTCYVSLDGVLSCGEKFNNMLKSTIISFGSEKAVGSVKGNLICLFLEKHLITDKCSYKMCFCTCTKIFLIQK